MRGSPGRTVGADGDEDEDEDEAEYDDERIGSVSEECRYCGRQ